jgi:hypothetical protein
MRERSVRQGLTMGTGSREREGVSPYSPWDTPAEPPLASDGAQHPLLRRCGYSPRLKRSVRLPPCKSYVEGNLSGANRLLYDAHGRILD